MRYRVGEGEKRVIRQGFEELILDLFELLAELTGEAIVNKLFAEEMPVLAAHTQSQRHSSDN
jgi:hypothetical protein